MEFDPRLVFYLEHKEQIDEWLQLPELEAMAADRFFAGEVSDNIESLPAELPGEPLCFKDPDDRWRKAFLYLGDWISDGAREPLVGIGLEWTAKSGFNKSYVGMRVHLPIERGEALYVRVKGEIQPVIEGFEGALDGLPLCRATRYWPVWAYLQPPPRFWDDLPGLNDRIAGHVAALWSSTWEAVNRAVLDWREEQEMAPHP